jgi:hypothetical protein
VSSRALPVACTALLVTASALAARGEDAKPAPKRAPFVCTRPQLEPLPSDATPRDRHDRGLRARLREVECELEFRKHTAAGAGESCYFGPEFTRISNQRYEEIRQAHKSDPVELWHALLREPEDPNLPPIEIRVTSKSGPNCGSDRDRQLEAEANALQKELNFR